MLNSKKKNEHVPMNGQCKQRNRNSKEESKGNHRNNNNYKTITEMKNPFDSLSAAWTHLTTESESRNF